MLSLQLLYLKNNICKIKAKPFCVNSSTEFQLRNAKPVWLLFSISAGLLHVFFKWLLLQNRLISCTGCFSLTFCRALLYEASDDSEFNTWPFAYGCAAAARAMGRMAMETAAWRSHRGNRARDSAAHPATHCQQEHDAKCTGTRTGGTARTSDPTGVLTHSFFSQICTMGLEMLLGLHFVFIRNCFA